jgi:hypothetical protein
VNNTYAGHKRQGEADYTLWHFTRDGSIDPEQRNYDELPEERRFLPIEIVSPVVSTTDAFPLLTRSYDLIQRVGGVTNSSCGLHFTFSSDAVSREDFNPLVFILLTEMLDQRDLRKTSRLRNRYCYPTATLFAKAWQRLRVFCGAAPLSIEHLLDPAVARGTVRVAGLGRHRHVSVNLVKFQTDGVIEYRGFGGDYLKTTTPAQIEHAMREYMTCALHASDPDWIEQNCGRLLHRLRSMDARSSYHFRDSYARCIGDVPHDMDINYLGSHRDIAENEQTSERDLVLGAWRISLNVHLANTRRAYIFINCYRKGSDNKLLTIVCPSDGHLHVDIHNSRDIDVDAYQFFARLIRYISQIKTVADMRKNLLRFYNSRTYHNYKESALPAARIISRAWERQDPQSRAPWLSAIRYLRSVHIDNLMSGRGRRRNPAVENRIDTTTYEWLNAVIRSYNKVSGQSTMLSLIDPGMEYRDYDSVYSCFDGSFRSSLASAIVVGASCGMSFDTIKSKSIRSWRTAANDTESLLRGHEAHVVGGHIAEKIYSEITHYLETGNRCFIQPAWDVASELSRRFHLMHRLPSVPVLSSDDASDYARRLFVEYLTFIKSKLDSGTSGVGQSKRDTFILTFRASLLNRFRNAVQAHDNSWSHSSRKELFLFILRFFSVHEIATSEAKERFGGSEMRIYNEVCSSLDAALPNIP